MIESSNIIFFTNINSFLKFKPTHISSLFILILIVFPYHSIVYSQSPYKLDFKKETIIFGVGTTLSLITLALNDNIKPLTNSEIILLNRNNMRGLDRSATFNWSEEASDVSDLLLAAFFVSPALLSLSEKFREDYTPLITMYFETLIFAQMLPFLAKGITKRARPFTYNQNVPLEKKKTQNARRSFFSGHASGAFAMAVFLSTVYNDYYPDSDWVPYVWGSSLLLASTVGYLRYEAGSHFPTDILAGAIVGSAIGYLIPFIHRVENNNFHLTLGLTPHGQSINLQFNF